MSALKGRLQLVSDAGGGGASSCCCCWHVRDSSDEFLLALPPAAGGGGGGGGGGGDADGGGGPGNGNREGLMLRHEDGPYTQRNLSKPFLLFVLLCSFAFTTTRLCPERFFPSK